MVNFIEHNLIRPKTAEARTYQQILAADVLKIATIFLSGEFILIVLEVILLILMLNMVCFCFISCAIQWGDVLYVWV